MLWRRGRERTIPLRVDVGDTTVLDDSEQARTAAAPVVLTDELGERLTAEHDFDGFSADDVPDIEDVLSAAQEHIGDSVPELEQFAVEAVSNAGYQGFEVTLNLPNGLSLIGTVSVRGFVDSEIEPGSGCTRAIEDPPRYPLTGSSKSR
ncbi:hypothetical protein ACWEU6_12835 [Streptosporangium sandarakinum]|uniref:hypothetical protein n=1 Tax=Streptosporangium sandarakinum TaxID=1260955 RepID=UPI003674FF9D